jgi:hypothetical protein
VNRTLVAVEHFDDETIEFDALAASRHPSEPLGHQAANGIEGVIVKIRAE